MLLTKAQLARFWRVWASAEREGLPPSATREERDAFRRGAVLRATGVPSLKDVGPGKAFDALMLEAATLACDYEEAAYWGNGGERRYAEMMRVCARQIGEIAGVPRGWEYCRATLKQAGLPERWEDVPETLLASTFKMLDTHRRRLLRRTQGWVSKGLPLGFSITRVYRLEEYGLWYYDKKPEKAETVEVALP